MSQIFPIRIGLCTGGAAVIAPHGAYGYFQSQRLRRTKLVKTNAPTRQPLCKISHMRISNVDPYSSAYSKASGKCAYSYLSITRFFSSSSSIAM